MFLIVAIGQAEVEKPRVAVLSVCSKLPFTSPFCHQIIGVAVHKDSIEAEKKSSKAMDSIPTFNAEHLQSNMKTIYYSRTFLSIIGGVIAGIMGFTSLTGFIFYFLIMAITSVGLLAKAGFTVHSYFDSWNRVLLDGFLGGLMSFVLFWTFAYDLVHIF
nr:er membrane protein complex subunit 6 [Quercus suber]